MDSVSCDEKTMIARRHTIPRKYYSSAPSASRLKEKIENSNGN